MRSSATVMAVLPFRRRPMHQIEGSLDESKLATVGRQRKTRKVS